MTQTLPLVDTDTARTAIDELTAQRNTLTAQIATEAARLAATIALTAHPTATHLAYEDVDACSMPTVAVIDAAGHDLNLDDPEAADAISDQLREAIGHITRDHLIQYACEPGGKSSWHGYGDRVDIDRHTGHLNSAHLNIATMLGLDAPLDAHVMRLPSTYAAMRQHLLEHHNETDETLAQWISDRTSPDSGEGYYPDNTPFQHLDDLHTFQHDNADNDFAHTHKSGE